MQKTFGDIVGLPPVVPTAQLPDDYIGTEDGENILRKDAFVDCAGKYWSSQENRDESNVTIVEDILNRVYQWNYDYSTDNSDYADSYYYIIQEDDNVKSAFKDYFDSFDFDGFVEKTFGVGVTVDKKKVLREFYNEIADYASTSYDCNEYASFDGDGVCIASFDIGEVEFEIDFRDFPELAKLHESGELDDILDRVDSDCYVYRTERRELNKETGKYESVGRKTYKIYGNNPNMLVYCSIPGQWHFAVSDEDIKSVLAYNCEYFLD